LAEQNGWKVGDTIPLNSFIWTKVNGSRTWEWRIVGIFDGKDEEWRKRANLMYLNYGQFDEGRNPGARGLAGVFVVRVDNANDSARVASAIDEKFKNSAEETKTQSEQEFQLGFIRQLGDIGLIVNLITGAVFFSILFLTGVAMSQAVRERIPELAVLKCLGFKDGTVMWLVLAECFALCVIGAGIGMGIASVLMQLPMIQNTVPVQADAYVWLIAALSVLLLTLLVGVPPAYAAQRLKIVDALAGRADDSLLENVLRKAISGLQKLWALLTGQKRDDGEPA
jgi:putative ABC transport system permease protein